jgi:hypothetical protein
MSDLQTFFDEMRPFLLGARELDEVESALGESPSGSERMAFYPGLVAWGHANFVEKLYPMTLARLGEDRSDDLIEIYGEEHPPNHWEPNQVGARFPAFLESRPDVDDWIAELARYEWFEFVVYLDRNPTTPPPDGKLIVNPTLHALPFRHDVPAWVASEACDNPESTPPEIREHFLVIYRQPETHSCRFMEVTPWIQIVVTALEADRNPVEAAMEAGAPPDQAREVIADLRARGLLLGDL